MSSEEVVNFLTSKPLRIADIEKLAELPNSTLQKAISGTRQLNAAHIKKLEPVLRDLGYKDPKPVQAQVIALINNKGGVAKTTSCLNMGAALVRKGKKVLVVDIDPQGNLSQCLGVFNPDIHIMHALTKGWHKDHVDPLPLIKINDNLDLLPCDERLQIVEMEITTSIDNVTRLDDILQPYKPVYDFILIDCPPSLAIFTRNALIAATHALILLEPERTSFEGLKVVLDLIYDIRRRMNKDLQVLGILLTKVNNRLSVHNYVSSKVRELMGGLKIFNTTIRLNAAIKDAQMVQKDIFDYDKKSHGAEDYMAFTEEALDILSNDNQRIK